MPFYQPTYPNPDSVSEERAEKMKTGEERIGESDTCSLAFAAAHKVS